MKSCLDCKYAEWERTSNGRLHPNKGGQCKYQIPVFTIPKAFYFIGGDQSASGGFIQRNRPYEDCPTWRVIDE